MIVDRLAATGAEVEGFPRKALINKTERRVKGEGRGVNGLLHARMGTGCFVPALSSEKVRDRDTRCNPMHRFTHVAPRCIAATTK
jgi:hypothetical protein